MHDGGGHYGGHHHTGQHGGTHHHTGDMVNVPNVTNVSGHGRGGRPPAPSFGAKFTVVALVLVVTAVVVVSILLHR